MEALITQVERQVPTATREQALAALKNNANDVTKAICELLARSDAPATKPPTAQRTELQAHWQKVRELFDYLDNTTYDAIKNNQP